ncbi:MAG TPA: glycosyltransferase family 39 protein [Candidatus Limnocylindria bacterium]|nr:glycosyltransferase family 39 protein [Candidatus Limnocylindria bacterium]
MPSSSRSPWKCAVFLFLFALALTSAGNWILPLVDRDEPRFAEASREMIERHDWIVPHFNGDYRFDKPPLIYWCQVACFQVLGQNEFAARLPSVVATAATTVLIFLFGRRLYGGHEGSWAAIMFATSLQTLIHGRLAVADMLMVVFVTAATWASWELIAARDQQPHRPSLGWWWILWVSLGLGFLAKGPVAFLPILGLIIFLRWNGSASPMTSASWAAGILVCLGIIALWGIPALVQTQGAFAKVGLGRHVVGRSIQPLEGHGFGGVIGYVATLPLYLVTVFLSFCPWVFLLPGIILAAWRRRLLGTREKWLLSMVAAIVVPFSLVATKLPHYILPAMPALALWSAASWFQLGREESRLRSMARGMTVAALLITVPGFMILSAFFPTPRLAQAVEPWVRPQTEIGSNEYDEPSLVWYFRKKTQGFHRSMPAPALKQFMAEPGPRLCVLPTKDVGQVFGTIPPTWHSNRVTGLNLVHGRKVDITILIRDTDP